MPTFGGESPFPLRFGGAPGGTTRLRRIIESLQSQMGTAYSTTASGPVYVWMNAMARIIDRDVYGVNERLASQFNPSTMTADGLLPRWEKVFGIVPPYGATEPARRAVVAAKWLSFVQANNDQPVRDALTAALGPVFVGITYVTPANAIEWWPGLSGTTASITAFGAGVVTVSGLVNAQGWAYRSNITLSNCATSANNGTFLISQVFPTTSVGAINPLGVSTDYGVGGTIGAPTIQWALTNPFAAWSSSVAHIAIQVQQPANYSNAQFYTAVGQIGALLDPLMPAWATWDWWLPNVQGGGGPGFYLDETDLDVEIFDV